ncbi:MAG: VacJ family lipoprotein [Thiohalobacterales bacterium]
MNITLKKLLPHALVLLAVLTLGACSTAPVLPEGEEPLEPRFSADRVLIKEAPAPDDEISDPWEGFNRSMYRFNYRFDKYVFLPAVNGYQFITPDFMQAGIYNFFRNIQDITTLINSILQLSPEKTANTTTRLVINSTIGILGFINVADDVPRSDEDFGQTLGHWGVGRGPYLVLPVLGPSSLRDGTGAIVDIIVISRIRDAALDLETWQKLTWSILRAVDLRSHVAARYYESGTPFEYEWLRLLYTTKRQLDIER